MKILRAAALGLAAFLWCLSGAVYARDTAEILVQVSLTAGLRYHDAKAVWDQMQVGDTLVLVREPDNIFDARAVRVEWNGHKLGYIPRTDNQALARQMDRGNPLQARVT